MLYTPLLQLNSRSNCSIVSFVDQVKFYYFTVKCISSLSLTLKSPTAFRLRGYRRKVSLYVESMYCSPIQSGTPPVSCAYHNSNVDINCLSQIHLHKQIHLLFMLMTSSTLGALYHFAFKQFNCFYIACDIYVKFLMQTRLC